MQTASMATVAPNTGASATVNSVKMSGYQGNSGSSNNNNSGSSSSSTGPATHRFSPLSRHHRFDKNSAMTGSGMTLSQAMSIARSATLVSPAAAASTPGGVTVNSNANHDAAAAAVAVAQRAGLSTIRLQTGSNLPVFEIPLDIYIDVLYCQKAMRTHLKVHQRLASHCMMQNTLEDYRLRSVEKQLVFIGHDQNVTLNRLRVCVNSYMHKLAEKNIIINRDEFDVLLGNEIKLHVLNTPHVDPIYVHRRQTEDELVQRLNLQNVVDHLTDPELLNNTEPTEPKSYRFDPEQGPSMQLPTFSAATTLTAMPAVTLTAIPRAATAVAESAIHLSSIHNNTSSNNGHNHHTETMEILLNPTDIAASDSAAVNLLSGKSQVSLLKPRAERIVHHITTAPAIIAGASTSASASAAELMLASLLPGVSVTPVLRNVVTEQLPALPPGTVIVPAVEPTNTPSPAMSIRRMNLLHALKMAKHQTENAAAEAAAAASVTAAATASVVKVTAAAADAAVAAGSLPTKTTTDPPTATPRSSRTSKSRAPSTVTPPQASPAVSSAPTSGDDENSNSALSTTSTTSSSPSSSATNEADVTYNPPKAAVVRPTDKATTSNSGAAVSAEQPTRGRPKGSKAKPKAARGGKRKNNQNAAVAENSNTADAKTSTAEPKAKRSRTSKSPSPNDVALGDNSNGADANASPEVVFVFPELPAEVPEPTEYDQDDFMRLFQLCTHDHHAHVVKVRSERPKRNVTSTERRDFHYGKLEVFEQQQRAVAKANKRPVLYSPPRTRRNRKPVAAASALVAAAKATEAAAAAAKAASRAAAKRAARSLAQSAAKVAAAAATAAAVAETAAAAASSVAAASSNATPAVTIAAMASGMAVRKTYSNRNSAKRSAQASVAAAKVAAEVAAAATAAAQACGSAMHDSDDGDEQMLSICVACKLSNTERVRECEDCNGCYHLNCHKAPLAASTADTSMAAAVAQSLLERERVCPECLRRRKRKTTERRASGNSVPQTSAQRRGK